MLRQVFGSKGEHWTYFRTDGREFGFRLKEEVHDDSELYAQGRDRENAERKRRLNALPLFSTRTEARAHFDKVV